MYVLNAVREVTVQAKPVASMPLPSVTPGKWMARVSYFSASGTWSLLLSLTSNWAGLGTWMAPDTIVVPGAQREKWGPAGRAEPIILDSGSRVRG